MTYKLSNLFLPIWDTLGQNKWKNSARFDLNEILHIVVVDDTC